MSLKMPKSLLPDQGMSRQEKFQVMQKRRTFVVDFARRAIAEMGYSLGESLKVPGAHAYQATRDGNPVRIGIKSCIDRWVAVPKDNAGEFGQLSRTDVLFIIAMDNWPESPKRLQIYKIDSKIVAKKAAMVHAEADRLQQTGQLFIPLDDRSDRSGTNMIAGSLQSHLELVLDEEIEWLDDPSPDSVSKDVKKDITPPLQLESSVRIDNLKPVKLTIAEAKAGLAENYGVSLDSIEITIRG